MAIEFYITYLLTFESHSFRILQIHIYFPQLKEGATMTEKFAAASSW